LIFRKEEAMPKKYLTKKELDEFRDMLLAKRERILESMDSFAKGVKVEDPDRVRGDEADLAASEVDGAMRARLQDKNRKLLGEINHALEKFEQDTYGICEGSEEYISKERLRLRPWTRYSVEYKEIVDKQKRQVQRH